MNDVRAPARAFEAFDHLATMVAVASPDGPLPAGQLDARERDGPVAAHAAARQRRRLAGRPRALREALRLVADNEVMPRPLRRADEAPARRVGSGELPVHVIVSQMDRPRQVLIEMIEIEQQTRLDREERAHGLAQANKELVRNLAHEIKNPLGGIRGAAQLLAMEVTSRELTEYTQVIIHEADRLQALVDRLLAPHRRPHVVGDVNIHEICERVRSLILAEYPRGLEVERDYDTSIPEFRGDREQLIQAVLNIAHNATQALAERIAGRTRAMRASCCAPAWPARSPSASSASTGTGIAYPGQRAGRARGHPRSHLPPAGVGSRRRLRPRADAGADLRAATPRHDRMRQRAGPDGVQAADPSALTT
jgi:two-component system nitrogen regulation sensor histidine kinase GlnL